LLAGVFCIGFGGGLCFLRGGLSFRKHFFAREES
jgi:uncharacterized protein involved in exopolysaccharide biosynthesis